MEGAQYTFPPQPLVISACAELARRLAGGQSCQGNTRPVTSWMQPSPTKEKGKSTEDSTLFVVGCVSNMYISDSVPDRQSGPTQLARNALSKVLILSLPS